MKGHIFYVPKFFIIGDINRKIQIKRMSLLNAAYKMPVARTGLNSLLLLIMRNGPMKGLVISRVLLVRHSLKDLLHFKNCLF